MSDESRASAPPTSRAAAIALAVAVLPLLAADIVGAAAIGAVLVPGPSGEWAELPLFVAYAFDVPIGLLGLALGGVLRTGPRGLRRLVLVTAVVALLLPLAGSLVVRIHRV
jgi:hypothetical protein